MALTDLLNKAKNIAEEKLNQHLNEFEKSEDEKEEDREKLLTDLTHFSISVTP